MAGTKPFYDMTNPELVNWTNNAVTTAPLYDEILFPGGTPEVDAFTGAGNAYVNAQAAQIAAEGAAKNATVAKICAGANVSNGLAAHYFENKEDLLSQAFARLLDDGSEATGRAAAGVEGPTAKLNAIFSTGPLDPFWAVGAIRGSGGGSDPVLLDSPAL